MRRLKSAVTPYMERLEEQRGQPIRTLIGAAYREHGNIDDAAASLGITQGTLSSWIRQLGGQVVRTGNHVVWEGEDGASADGDLLARARVLIADYRTHYGTDHRNQQWAEGQDERARGWLRDAGEAEARERGQRC